MRCAKRAPPPSPWLEFISADRAHSGSLQGIGLGHRWQDAGQAPREHGFASTRRTKKQDVVAQIAKYD